MDKKTIEAFVLGLVSDLSHMGKEEINRDSTFDGLHMDSLDINELVVFIESEYDIEITEETMVEVNTVGKLLDCVYTLVGVQS